MQLYVSDLGFNKAGTERFLEEMATAGVPSVRSYVQDQCFVGLTRNTASFSLSYLLLADSLLRLFSPSMRQEIRQSTLQLAGPMGQKLYFS